ncbi:MAG: RNA polymerase sigma factor [Anaerolineales bacterium]
MSEAKHNPIPDAALVARAQDGDTDAFGMLYERYVDQIFRYVRTRVSETRDAEDLTESVFVRSFEALDGYEERGHPYTAFLYQVARNVLVDHYRKPEEEQGLDDVGPLISRSPDLERRIEEDQQVQIIRRAMENLTEDYQEVIRLRVLLSLPTANVAEWLDRSEGAVRVLLYRALKALRKEVELVSHDG